MSNFSFLKTEDGMGEIVQYNPGRFGPLMVAAENIMRSPAELSVAERELIFAYVSGNNACAFCFGSHKAIAHAFGIDENLLDELLQSEVPSAAGAKLLPCLQLAQKASSKGGNGNRISKTDVDAIVEAGWLETTAHDVLSVAALANLANTLVNGHGVQGSAERFEEAANRLGPGGGYAG